MKTKILDILTLIIGLASVVLVYADEVKPLDAISPDLAARWGLFVGAALVVQGIARTLGDYLDDGKINGSFKSGVLALIVVTTLGFLTGCTTTTADSDGNVTRRVGIPGWLTLEGCYELPDGTEACAGVKDSKVNITARKDIEDAEGSEK